MELFGQTQANLNITYAGMNGDLPDTVPYDLDDGSIRRIATEAIAGGVAGITATAGADLTDFVVDRFAATNDLPARIVLRPKTPFGG